MSHTTPGFPNNSAIAKAQAKRLRSALEPDHKIGHSQALELLARIHGEQNWARMNSLFLGAAPQGIATPNSPIVPTTITPKASKLPLPDNHLEQRALQALLKGLQQARPTNITPKARSRANEIARDEIISTQCFETWLDQLDVKLGGMVFDMNVENLIKVLKIKTISRYQRPRSDEKEVYGSNGLRIADFAAALIQLNRFGFDTHPEVFIEPLLGSIKKSRFVDQSELDCLWFDREQKKFTFQKTFYDAVTEIQNSRQENFTMSNGTKVSVERQPDGLHLIRRINLVRY